MNRFKEYLTVPFGFVEAEADEEAVLSIRLLRKGEAPEEGCESNLYTGLCLQQLKEFFAGDRKAFSFPYRLTGTDFQNGVWEEIAKIPQGAGGARRKLAKYRSGFRGSGCQSPAVLHSCPPNFRQRSLTRF